jgi:hypothetical protein
MTPSASLLLCTLGLFGTSCRTQPSVQSDTLEATDRAQSPESKLKLYAVEDLFTRIMSAGLTPEKELDSQAQAERVQTFGERTTSWVKRFMEPAWDPEANRIESHGGMTLLVQGSAEQHAWVTRWLEAMRDSELGFVSVSSSLIEFPRLGLKDLGGLEPWATRGVASAAQAELLLTAREQLKQREGWQMLSAPRLTTRPFERANISVLNQIAYVKGVEVVLEFKDAVADPVIEIVQEGLVLDMTCGPIAPGQLGLALSFDRSDVELPIATRTVRVATEPPTEVEIQTPIVDHVKLSTWFRVPDGGLVYLTMPSNEPDRDLLFFAEVTSLPEPK